MAKKSLRAQLNQIRAWVRQGRTDAWIAHQLEVPASELREFRRRHDLTADGDADADGEVDLRDEIEAEIEAATLEEDDEDEDEEDDEDEADEEDEAGGEDGDGKAESDNAGSDGGDGDADKPAPKRRRRRGRRGRGGGAKRIEASFDHGEKDGYGLWLDPAVADNPVYKEHWAGHSAVEVQVEPDRITIRRS